MQLNLGAPVFVCLRSGIALLLIAIMTVPVRAADGEDESAVVQASPVDAPVVDAPPAVADAQAVTTLPVQSMKSPEDEEEVRPWDYDPYKILIWVVSDELDASEIEVALRRVFDREYRSIWRLTIQDAPVSVSSSALRDLAGLTYDAIAATDPVIAVKRDHKDAVRIRTAATVGEYVPSVLATAGMIADVKQRGSALGRETLDGAADKLKPIDGDGYVVLQKWAETETEALLVTRGLASTLDSPKAKLIDLPIDGLVSSAVDAYDKIFIVTVQRDTGLYGVSVLEFNTLMRFFGRVVNDSFISKSEAPESIGRAVSKAFSPEVRIDQAGLKGAQGLLRAGGLIVDKSADALVQSGDVLVPLVRKNDRNGSPIMIGPLDWAYLLAVEPKPIARDDAIVLGEKGQAVIDVLANDYDPTGDKLTIETIDGKTAKVGSPISVTNGMATLLANGKIKFVAGKEYQSPTKIPYTITDGKGIGRGYLSDTLEPQSDEEETTDQEPPNVDHSRINMEFYSGRAGGLQGRANKRTFKRALRIRSSGDATMIRLHAKGKPNFPLIGYELYEKELYSKKMTFIGRTDWNGCLNVTTTEDPLRLLYVKNGGAVLARLPIVPGYTPFETADLTGDDMRLQAEAYVNGVANAIVDLVAIRKLLGTRIRSRLKKGQMKEAEELLLALREQPSKDILSNDMERKQAYFLSAIGSRNANARRLVDNMFTSTRKMLDTQISQREIKKIEEDFVRAKSNGGKLPDDPDDGEEEYDASVNEVGNDDKKKK